MAGGSNGTVCSAVGTSVQVKTGPVRGVRSQYRLGRQRVGRDRHLPRIGPARLLAEEAREAGRSLRRRGRRNGPSGGRDERAGAGDDGRPIRLEHVDVDLERVAGGSDLAVGERVHDDSGRPHERVLELGDLDREKEIGLRFGVGRRRQRGGRGPRRSRGSQAACEHRHQLDRCAHDVGARQRLRRGPVHRRQLGGQGALRQPGQGGEADERRVDAVEHAAVGGGRAGSGGGGGPGQVPHQIEVGCPRAADFDAPHLLRLVLAAPFRGDLAEAAAEQRIHVPVGTRRVAVAGSAPKPCRT